MDNLVKRYIAFIQRERQQSEGVSEDDVNEIKQDISAFRFELLEILKRNSFDTGHANIAQRTTAKNKRKSAMAERQLMKAGFSAIPEDSNDMGSSLSLARPAPRPLTTISNPSTVTTDDRSSASPTRSADSRLNRFKLLSKKITAFTPRTKPLAGNPLMKRAKNSHSPTPSLGLAGKSMSVNLELADSPGRHTERTLVARTSSTSPRTASSRVGQSASSLGILDQSNLAEAEAVSPLSDCAFDTASTLVQPDTPGISSGTIFSIDQYSRRNNHPVLRKQSASIEPEPSDITL